MVSTPRCIAAPDGFEAASAPDHPITAGYKAFNAGYGVITDAFGPTTDGYDPTSFASGVSTTHHEVF